MNSVCGKCGPTQNQLKWAKLCSHILCATCLKLMYANATTPLLKCYQCQTMLREKDYTHKDPLLQQVETDNENRKQILKVYNQKRSDFDTQEAYDAYLEEVEEIIFVLADETASEADKDRVRKRYQKQRAENLQKIASKNAQIEDQMKVFK